MCSNALQQKEMSLKQKSSDKTYKFKIFPLYEYIFSKTNTNRVWYLSLFKMHPQHFSNVFDNLIFNFYYSF